MLYSGKYSCNCIPVCIIFRPSSSHFDDKVTAYYTVYGAYVGHTNMRASVKLPNGQVIYSSPKPVEVFPPLKLDPQNITLVVGSTFQVLAQGGPQPQSYVEFTVVHDKISTVTGGGLLIAVEVGTTQVIGKAIGTHSSTGENIIYSQVCILFVNCLVIQMRLTFGA
ncbi:hypothetical protein SNE40_014130 [Patella caerulea]|uniref:BIG2 domain-containing protein n=1 Tax=Patella caerulea TaxID=87958 RepID=A0AAN8PC86_PATCE